MEILYANKAKTVFVFSFLDVTGKGYLIYHYKDAAFDFEKHRPSSCHEVHRFKNRRLFPSSSLFYLNSSEEELTLPASGKGFSTTPPDDFLSFLGDIQSQLWACCIYKGRKSTHSISFVVPLSQVDLETPENSIDFLSGNFLTLQLKNQRKGHSKSTIYLSHVDFRIMLFALSDAVAVGSVEDLLDCISSLEFYRLVEKIRGCLLRIDNVETDLKSFLLKPDSASGSPEVQKTKEISNILSIEANFLNQLDKFPSDGFFLRKPKITRFLAFQKTVDLHLSRINAYIGQIPYEVPLHHSRFVFLDNSEDNVFYRGVTQDCFLELPKIFRNRCLIEREDESYRQYTQAFPEVFKDKTYCDCLTQMQHYELPTRLLDVSTNPLVALYMAASTQYSVNSTKEIGEIVVYFSNYQSASGCVKYQDSWTVEALSSLSILSYEKKSALKDFLKKAVQLNITASEVSDVLLGHKEDSFYSNLGAARLAYSTFVQNMRKKHLSFNPELFNPYDILHPVFLKPNQINERVKAQSGCFILFGLDEENSASPFVSTRTLPEAFRIAVVDKEKILEQLAMLNIDQATLTPDLDNVAKYIKSINDHK